jgi:hypothetical protein
MAWGFLIMGTGLTLICASGLVYFIAHGDWQGAAEFGIGLALFGGMPWLGFKMLRDREPN